MKTNFLPKLFLGLTTLTSVGVYAGGPPVMFSNCATKTKVELPKNSNGHYFSADCRTVYVLPPLHGNIEMSPPTKTYNTQICTSVATVFASLEAQNRKVERLIRQIDMIESQIAWSDDSDPWIDGTTTPPIDEAKTMADIKKLDELREMVADTSLKSMTYNEKLSEYEGPRLRLTLTMDHDKLVQAYRDRNPNLDVQRMPLAKSVLTFIAKTSRNVGKAPAAIDWNVAGLFVTQDYFTGIKPSDLANDLGDVNSAKSVLFSSTVSGQVLLSLIGACPFYDKGKTMSEHMSASDISPYITASADYAYNVMVNRHYKAKYNLASLFKRIQKQTKKGGFFSSKTIHSLVIEKDSKGWFEFESLSEDNRINWDEQLAQTIKGQIINRLLTRLGAEPIGKNDPPAMITPGKHGAEVISDGLNKCPHLYCQVAGFVLKGLDSAIGRSTAISEFIETQNHWESEEVKESKMLPLLNQVTFKD